MRLTKLCFLLLLCTPSCGQRQPASGLPLLRVFTRNGAQVQSKDAYVEGQADLKGTRGIDSFSARMRIRGRGNSTWRRPKKPYQIKFEEEVAFMGMPAGRKWVLLANYDDKTMLRNRIAFEYGGMSTLAWTPQSAFCEVSINDDFLGVYEVSQKVEEGRNRVSLGEDGFLVEVERAEEADADAYCFETTQLSLCVKGRGGSQRTRAQFQDLEEYVNAAEAALYGDQFTDQERGYAKYLDVPSFVDWYLINEIAKNVDAVLLRSGFMRVLPGRNISMGPIWDFDGAFGNVVANGRNSHEKFCVKNAPWIVRLFEDPDFVAKVKERFQYFKTKTPEIIASIQRHAERLRVAQARNDAVWKTIGMPVKEGLPQLDTYEAEIEFLKSWIEKRLSWLEEGFGVM